jgi:anti-sigma regulatory factor (Ser/Thr protein kinase)
VPSRAIRQLNLALDELLTNVISYAWPDGGNHRVRLVVTAAEGSLTAEIADDGVAFDPRTAPEPDLTGSIEERAVGGLGVHLALTLVDRIDYRRVGDENRVTLHKTFEPREPQRD